MRVAFLYNAQDHHLLHSLPVACELSRLRPGWEVCVLARSEAQLELARDLARTYPGQRLVFHTLRLPAWLRVLEPRISWPKLLILIANRAELDTFDALVVPERTSLHLKRLGVTRPKYIHTFHGSSGHDRVDDPRLDQFDLLLAPSPRRLDRILEVRPRPAGTSAVIGYSKQDLVSRLSERREAIFANDRPTVIYNPHHWPSKSSWPVIGEQVLDCFADQSDYNLIFAPHVRLFDPPAGKYEAFRKYLGLDHMRIDLGSRRSIDMTYLMAADIYLGDVSSQVFEFISRPRPCIFLNPRRFDWRDDPDFASWRLGPVVETLAEMQERLRTVGAWAGQYRTMQEEANRANFPAFPEPAPQRGARAIAAFLECGRLPEGWDVQPSPAA